VRTAAGGRAAHHARRGRCAPDPLAPATQAAGPAASNARARRGRARCGVGAQARTGGAGARHAPRRRSLLGAETRARSRQTWPCARA